MKTVVIRAAALLAFAAPAFAAAPTAPRQADSPPNTAAYKAKAMDERFLKAAYSGNMLEIRLSQYACEQLKDHKEVKELAEMLVKHHEMGKKMVAEAAQKCGVQLSEDLLPAHKAKLEMATEVKGETYHVPYLFALASSHTAGILEVSHRMHFTEDAAVKAYCEHMLPKLKAHFGKIKPMAEKEARVTEMTAAATEK